MPRNSLVGSRIAAILFLAFSTLQTSQSAAQIHPEEGSALLQEFAVVSKKLEMQRAEFIHLSTIPYFPPSIEASLLRENLGRSGALLGGVRGAIPTFHFADARQSMVDARAIMAKTDVMLSEDMKATSQQFRESHRDNFSLPTEQLVEKTGLQIRTRIWNETNFTQRIVNRVFRKDELYEDSVCQSEQDAFAKKWGVGQFTTIIDNQLLKLDYSGAQDQVWQAYSFALQISQYCKAK